VCRFFLDIFCRRWFSKLFLFFISIHLGSPPIKLSSDSLCDAVNLCCPFSKYFRWGTINVVAVVTLGSTARIVHQLEESQTILKDHVKEAKRIGSQSKLYKEGDVNLSHSGIHRGDRAQAGKVHRSRAQITVRSLCEHVTV